MIIHDAATAVLAVRDAAIAWLWALAFVACVALFALGPLVAPAVKGARRRLSGPSWARGRVRARIHARTRVRAPHARTAHLPHWARTQPHTHDLDEAA